MFYNLPDILELVDNCLINLKAKESLPTYVEMMHGRNVVHNIYWHRIRSNPKRKSYP